MEILSFMAASLESIPRPLNVLGRRVPCTIVRGGSSKGIYIERDVLPPPGHERDAVVLAMFGSPDRRQIDGLGGADKLTSKVAVMGSPTRDDCDVDYLFGQVNIELPRIDWKSNCGNLSAGAAIYAIARGYVEGPERGDVTVRIHVVNTGQVLRATVPVLDAAPAIEGDFAIGGVPGTGARVDLDWADFRGPTLGRGVLPTGNVVDRYTVPGLGALDVSVVDMANLCLFVRASDVGMDDERDIVTLQNDAAVVARLESIRAEVSRALGFIDGPNAAEDLLVKMNPLLFVVGAPRTYTALNGATIAGDSYDLFSRSITRAAFSKAYPGTGSIGTAIACGIDGTLAAQNVRGGAAAPGSAYSVRVGHPSGLLTVRATVDRDADGAPAPTSAVVGRTARVIMEGVCYIR